MPFSRRIRLPFGAGPAGAPLIAGVLLLLLGIAAALNFARDRANEATEQGERQRLQARLSHLATSQAAQIVEFRSLVRSRGGLDGSPAEAQRAALSASRAGQSFDAIYLLESGRVVRGLFARNGEADMDRDAPAIDRVAVTLDSEDLRGSQAAREGATAPSPRLETAQTLFAQAGDAVLVLSFAAVATPAHDGAADGRALVGLYRLDRDRLAALGAGAGVGLLAIGSSGDAALTVPQSASLADPVVLSWRPFRPGDRDASLIAPLIAGLAALVAAFIAYVARSATQELARREQSAREAGGRDALSGLLNRGVFNEAIETQTRQPERKPFAIHYVDLDRFKEINDSFGHDCGDQAIREATRRISALLGPQDVCARLGGDEFAILQRGVASRADGEALARRIVEAMREPVDLFGQPVHCGASIGLAFFPEDGAERESLLRAADIALYRAKSEGRGRHALFDARMADERGQKKQIEMELRRAIDSSELLVHYQPIVASDGKRIVGAEALVRWRHPTRGLIPPVQFIQIAEDRGLIGPLGEFVLRRACSDALRWRDIHVAVNVSPVQFRQKNFVAAVQRVLDTTGLDAGRLELEITESAIITEESQAEDAMIDLRAKGVRLALDDFGTGYSSLIYLRRFAFDKIKIDRSFLESMESTGESAIIVHSVVHLGRALGLTVTAEGIETAEQHRFLQAVGCHELQGYYFAKPLPREEFEKLLARQDGLMPRIAVA